MRDPLHKARRYSRRTAFRRRRCRSTRHGAIGGHHRGGRVGSTATAATVAAATTTTTAAAVIATTAVTTCHQLRAFHPAGDERRGARPEPQGMAAVIQTKISSD